MLDRLLDRDGVCRCGWDNRKFWGRPWSGYGLRLPNFDGHVASVVNKVLLRRGRGKTLSDRRRPFFGFFGRGKTLGRNPSPMGDLSVAGKKPPGGLHIALYLGHQVSRLLAITERRIDRTLRIGRIRRRRWGRRLNGRRVMKTC